MIVFSLSDGVDLEMCHKPYNDEQQNNKQYIWLGIPTNTMYYAYTSSSSLGTQWIWVNWGTYSKAEADLGWGGGVTGGTSSPKPIFLNR